MQVSWLNLEHEVSEGGLRDIWYSIYILYDQYQYSLILRGSSRKRPALPVSPARLRSSVQVQYGIPAEEGGSRSRGRSLYFVSLTPDFPHLFGQWKVSCLIRYHSAFGLLTAESGNFTGWRDMLSHTTTNCTSAHGMHWRRGSQPIEGCTNLRHSLGHSKLKRSLLSITFDHSDHSCNCSTLLRLVEIWYRYPHGAVVGLRGRHCPEHIHYSNVNGYLSDPAGFAHI